MIRIPEKRIDKRRGERYTPIAELDSSNYCVTVGSATGARKSVE